MDQIEKPRPMSTKVFIPILVTSSMYSFFFFSTKIEKTNNYLISGHPDLMTHLTGTLKNPVELANKFPFQMNILEGFGYEKNRNFISSTYSNKFIYIFSIPDGSCFKDAGPRMETIFQFRMEYF